MDNWINYTTACQEGSAWWTHENRDQICLLEFMWGDLQQQQLTEDLVRARFTHHHRPVRKENCLHTVTRSASFCWAQAKKKSPKGDKPRILCTNCKLQHRIIVLIHQRVCMCVRKCFGAMWFFRKHLFRIHNAVYFNNGMLIHLLLLLLCLQKQTVCVPFLFSCSLMFLFTVKIKKFSLRRKILSWNLGGRDLTHNTPGIDGW